VVTETTALVVFALFLCVIFGVPRTNTKNFEVKRKNLSNHYSTLQNNPDCS
jgi:hypothetical protein